MLLFPLYTSPLLNPDIVSNSSLSLFLSHPMSLSFSFSMEKTTSSMDNFGSRIPPSTIQQSLLTSPFIGAANTIPLESSLLVNQRMYTPHIITSMTQCYATSQCLPSPWPFNNNHSIKEFNFMSKKSNSFRFCMTNPPPTLTNQINFDVPGSLSIMNQQFLLANALGRSFFSPTRGLNHHLGQASISHCFSPIMSPEKSSFCYSARSFSIRTHEYPNRAWNTSFQQHIFPSGYPDLANQAAFMEPGLTNPFHDPNLQSIYPLPNYENVYGDCPSNGSPLTSQEMNIRYKCDLCSAEFPTGQAYGGHMSSHSKIRKADRALGEPSKKLKKFKTIPWTPEISNDGKELNLHFFNETAKEEKEKGSGDNVGLKSSTEKDEKKSVATNHKEKGKSYIGEILTKAPSSMDDEFANKEATLTGTTSLLHH